MTPRYPNTKIQKLDQKGRFRKSFIFITIVISIFGLGNLAFARHTTAITPQSEIQSAIEGYCIDDLHNDRSANASIVTLACNDSAEQNWSYDGTHFLLDQAYCLGVDQNGTSVGDQIVLNICNNQPGQDWTVDLGGYQNLNSNLCLTVPHGQPGTRLVTSSCNSLDQPKQGWSVTHYQNPADQTVDCTTGDEGQRVACNAEKQWMLWQAQTSNHTKLLNQYTAGNAYEEWCADFVSYVYKLSGYPFQSGERNNWDEYDANNLIYASNFIVHDASSYTPKPGDIAYFNYSGGHVELVVIGGKTPTFIYGDSGTTDPTTNNGEMNEDMLTSDGSAGQVQYYLSPK